MSVHPDTLVQCAQGLEIRIVSGTDIRLVARGHQIHGSQFTLRVLDAFRQPATIAQALERLGSFGTDTRQWIELTGCILHLQQAGALVDASSAIPVLRSDPWQFDSYPVHIRMLNDRDRTTRYQRAIRSIVKPGDVVVDIGTGSGVMAASAALAGAARVYAIERTDMAKVARRVFEANHLADRITVIEAQSTDVELPERADVLISEIIGDDPLAEDVLAVTNDAILRLLKPSARMIPSLLRLYALPFAAPADFVSSTVADATTLHGWRELYGIDFSPLLVGASAQDHHARISSCKTREWQALGNPVELASLDLSAPNPLTLEVRGRFDIEQSSILNAILLYFSAQLAPDVGLSTAPALATATSNWSSVVWLPGTPRPVSAGDQVHFSYRYSMMGSDFELLS